MTPLDVRAEGAHLLVGGHSVELPYPVRKVIVCGDLALVLMDPPAGEECNRNVMAFTIDAKMAWRIEASPHGTQSDKPYVGLTLDPIGRVIAANWIGIDYVVDHLSGKIEPIAFRK
jgi:hypothetical protein